jgi:transketolase
MHHDNLEARFASFGWHVLHTEGNNIASLNQAFDEAKKVKNKPTVIIANTIKGYGVSFMENKKEWHHRVPNAEEYQLAIQELEQRREALMHE